MLNIKRLVDYKYSFNIDNIDKKLLIGIFWKMLWCDVKNNEVLLLMLIGYLFGKLFIIEKLLINIKLV